MGDSIFPMRRGGNSGCEAGIKAGKCRVRRCDPGKQVAMDNASEGVVEAFVMENLPTLTMVFFEH